MKKLINMLCVVLAVVVVGCDSDTPVEHVSPQFVSVPTGTDSVDVDRMVASLDSAATVYAAGTLRTAAFASVVRAYLNITGTTPGPTPPSAPLPPVSGDTIGVSLQDLATLGRTYKGLRGGLYPSGNVAPTSYLTAGQAVAAGIAPINGKIVMMTVGMSNTQFETCGNSSLNPRDCTPGAWKHRAHFTDAARVNRSLMIVNGARYGHTAVYWDDPTDAGWTHAASRLAQKGVTPSQVQVLWIKVVTQKDPSVPLPSTNADARQLHAALKKIIPIAKSKYPNLRMVFVSDRIAATGSTPHPEPFAYETSFAVKWLVQDYISGALPSVPWIGWGPTLWAPLAPRARLDGAQWLASDLAPDGVHPSAQGVAKLGGILHNYFLTRPETCWYRASGC